MMNKYCFALDLKNNPVSIEEYKAYHKGVWPEILESIRDVGITGMEIYLTGNRLFMIMETDVHFSFDAKVAQDESNEKVQAWEALMWKYQQAIPSAKPGEKWVQMDKIFDLTEQA